MSNKYTSDNNAQYSETVDVRHLESNIVEGSTLRSSDIRSIKILLVDDSSDIAFTLKLGLENNDSTIQVYTYDNPVNALSDFKPSFYDLLLIDINMPLMNGFELCEKLLQQDLNVKVCFMTSGEINVEAAREVHPLKSIGCFIKKPITADALIKRIRVELE